jgi:hypothetical protein
MDGREVRREGTDADPRDAEAEETGCAGAVNSLFRRLISHIDGYVILFALIAVASFWFAIQLCWSMVGKRWYSAVGRLIGALVLFALGVVMIFLTAFGA